MTDNDKEISEAAKDWWRHFTTPESAYEGGWRQRNDMIKARKRKLEALLRKACGATNDVRRSTD
ncbi:MAG: hypothetical protein AB7L09_02950 [Nitrospira sp.]